jgi:hypothetical protein
VSQFLSLSRIVVGFFLICSEVPLLLVACLLTHSLTAMINFKLFVEVLLFIAFLLENIIEKLSRDEQGTAKVRFGLSSVFK